MTYEQGVPILEPAVQPLAEQMTEAHALEIFRLTPLVDARVAEAAIDPEAWNRLTSITDRLAEHSKKHYAHSLRVGIYAYDLARAEGNPNPAFALMAGVSHDVGKVAVDPVILEMTTKITKAQFVAQAVHPAEGYRMLEDEDPLLALVAGLHHKYREDGYGIDIVTEAPADLSPEELADAIAMAQLIMVVDGFDAATTRRDGNSSTPFWDLVAKKRELIEAFPQAVDRINWLFANRLSSIPQSPAAAKVLDPRLVTAK